MDLISAIVAVAIVFIIAMAVKNCPTKPQLEEPVMERGRAKGMLTLGKRDYGASDVTTVAQQETVREWTEETKNNKVNIIIITDSSIKYLLFLITCQHSFYLT